MTTAQVSRPLGVWSCNRIQTAITVSVMLAMNPVDTYCLGDAAYFEQVAGSITDSFYGRYSDSISAPAGSGLSITVGAAVNGALPAGDCAILSPGNGYPAAGPIGSLAAATLSAFFVPVGGLLPGQIPASGTITTTSSRQVSNVHIYHGGNLFDNTGPATPMVVVPSCSRDFWPLKYDHMHADIEWQLLEAARAAGMNHYVMFDDHELISNLTFHINDLYSRKSNGAPWWESMTGQTNLLNFFREAAAGFDLMRKKWFDNPEPLSNLVDIPAGLVGTPGVTPDDFKIRYFFVDYGAGMTRGGNKLRVIQTDTMSYKSPFDATDDGTGTSGKTMLGFTQVQWLIATSLDAKAKGMSVIWLMPKDIANIQNGDSWRATVGNPKGYVGELNYLLGRIEALDLPVVCVVGGDRHQAHAAMFDVRNGDAGTVLSICPCPYGADPAGLFAYPQQIWVNQDPDCCVFGAISLLEDGVRCQIIDAHSGRELFGSDTAFGQRRPREIRMVTAGTQAPAMTQGYAYDGPVANRPLTGIKKGAKAIFQDLGPGGSEWIWDGQYWGPRNPVVMSGAAGTIAAPLGTLVNVASGTFLTPPALPAGLLVRPGMSLRCQANIVRTTGNATANVRFGADSNNDVAAVLAVGSTSGRAARLDGSLNIASATTQTAELLTPPNGTAANGMLDRAFNFNNAVSIPITLDTAGTTDRFVLTSYKITLYP